MYPCDLRPFYLNYFVLTFCDEKIYKYIILITGVKKIPTHQLNIKMCMIINYGRPSIIIKYWCEHIFIYSGKQGINIIKLEQR